MSIRAPKVPVRRTNESFDDYIDRVNQGSSDDLSWLRLLAILLALIGLYLCVHA